MVSLHLRQLVRERAGNACEYCRLHQQFSPLAALQIEHILPLKHGGLTISENLALACISCNLHKGSDLSGIDPLTDQLTPLFNPRLQNWGEHFQWEGVELVGSTSIGRTTIRVLQLNSPERLLVRLASRG